MFPKITDPGEYATYALANSHKYPVVVVVSAAWCGPCKSYKPALAKIADERALSVMEIDAGNAKELLAELGVRAVPTTIVLKGGVEVLRKTGGMTEAEAIREFNRVGAFQQPLPLE